MYHDVERAQLLTLTFTASIRMSRGYMLENSWHCENSIIALYNGQILAQVVPLFLSFFVYLFFDDMGIPALG